MKHAPNFYRGFSFSSGFRAYFTANEDKEFVGQAQVGGILTKIVTAETRRKAIQLIRMDLAENKNPKLIEVTARVMRKIDWSLP